MRKMRRIAVWILAVLMILGLAGSVMASEAQEEVPVEKTGISVPFVSTLDHKISTWEFPYTDDSFRESSGTFSIELAKASMGLTISAFHNAGTDLEDQYETYLTGAGFSDIYAFGYELETSKDTLAGVIGWKQIDDFILIAAVPRGNGYGKEWAGNLELGTGERHAGFNRGAQIMETQIMDYIENHGLTGKMKLWLSGFSRASAVANLTAADMIGSGLFEDVYAYLFAVPRTTKAPEPYTGIYNICGKYDPVTQVPLQSWGYERYGTDLYTPAMEMDSRYTSLAINATMISFELMNDYFKNNPEVNFQLHLIMEFLGEMFPTGEDYAEKFQDSLMAVWEEANPDTIGLILTQAFSQLENLDERQEYSSTVFLDYLTYIMSQHLLEKQSQIETGSWDPEQSIAENVMREHFPYIYLEWIFSDNDLESLLHGPEYTRRVTISGEADVEIWMDGKMIRGIDRNGKDYYAEENEIDWDAINSYEDYIQYLKTMDDVILVRSGTDTLACLPLNRSVQIIIRTEKLENLVYYDVVWSPNTTYGQSDKMYSVIAQKGEYALDILEYEQLPELTVLEGGISGLVDMPFTYSPTVEMAQESGSTNHITVPGVIVLLIGTQVFIILLLIVCLIILIVHFIRRKKRGRPYSPLFVIIPHVILIIIFHLETQFFTFNLFTIGYARLIFAAITMVIIILLALRGLIRRRCRYSLIAFGIVLAVAALNVLWYQRSSLVSSALFNFIIYSLCVAGLTVLASSIFYRKRKTVQEQAASAEL